MEVETKTHGDEVKTEEGNEDSSRVHQGEPPLDSVAKPLVEEFTQAAKSLVQNVADQSSSYIAQVEKEFGNLVLVQESQIKGASDENAGQSSEASKSTSAEQENVDLDEKSRSTHSQPFIAANAATHASWTNCCGLLDLLRPSD